MTMIETMAKASHDFFRTKYTLLPPWDELPDEAKQTAMDHARAVLAAQRIPTDDMAEAVFAETGDPCWKENAIKAWQAGIDAALNEKPAP